MSGSILARKPGSPSEQSRIRLAIKHEYDELFKKLSSDYSKEIEKIQKENEKKCQLLIKQLSSKNQKLNTA